MVIENLFQQYSFIMEFQSQLVYTVLMIYLHKFH